MYPPSVLPDGPNPSPGDRTGGDLRVAEHELEHLHSGHLEFAGLRLEDLQLEDLRFEGWFRNLRLARLLPLQILGIPASLPRQLQQAPPAVPEETYAHL